MSEPFTAAERLSAEKGLLEAYEILKKGAWSDYANSQCQDLEAYNKYLEYNNRVIRSQARVQELIRAKDKEDGLRA
jgi:hypothetical protein